MVVGALVAIIQVSTIAFFAPIVKWIERAPEIGRIIREKLDAVGAVSPIFRRLQDALLSGDGSGLKVDVSSVIEPVVGFLTPALGQLIIFLAALFFVLIGHAQLRRSVILMFSGKEARLRGIHAMNEIEEDLARYVAAYPKPPAFRKHVIVDPVVVVDGDEAEVDSYWILLHREQADGMPVLAAFGRSHDRVVRRDGRWLIAERFAEVEATTFAPVAENPAEENT